MMIAMKTKLFKVIFIATVAFICVAGTVAGEEYTQKKHKAWLNERVVTLEIKNKYGDINIKEMTGDSVTVDVIITVEKGNATVAKRIFSKIDIDFNHSGSTASVETEFTNSFKNGEKFRIDYFVAIPEDRNLKIQNKYGQVNMENLKGWGDFNVQYGGINGDKLLSSKLKINVQYGEIHLEETKSVDLDMKYSKFFCDRCENVFVESAYSAVNVKAAKDMNVASRYDHYDIGEVSVFDVQGQFTTTKINTLHKKLQLRHKYGAFLVRNVSADFDELNVEAQYCKVKLGIDEDAAYSINADMKYCRVKYPEGKAQINYRVQSAPKMEVRGQIGNNPKGTVVLRSAYGEVSLIK